MDEIKTLTPEQVAKMARDGKFDYQEMLMLLALNELVALRQTIKTGMDNIAVCLNDLKGNN
jgi:hypothetical protein